MVLCVLPVYTSLGWFLTEKTRIDFYCACVCM